MKGVDFESPDLYYLVVDFSDQSIQQHQCELMHTLEWFDCPTEHPIYDFD